MTPSPQSSAPGPGSAQYPPLPDLSSSPGQGASAAPGGFMAQLMGAVTPVKKAVDQINAACQQIVQSGSVPGSEQIAAQIVSLANQLVVMSMQQAAQGGMGGGMSAGPGAGAGPIAPPAGAPPMSLGQ